MCLGIPSKIVSVDETHKTGQVDHLGTRVLVSFALLDEARIGEWVIVHAGFAISKLDDQEARETLDLLREIAAHE
ncbi:MAG: HypC/HybG/HupF family hydrogenase formation chaperone [Candidatus Aminicenantales bacterium]|jgi:hydrogenase expression/formation protein HypC